MESAEGRHKTLDVLDNAADNDMVLCQLRVLQRIKRHILQYHRLLRHMQRVLPALITPLNVLRIIVESIRLAQLHLRYLVLIFLILAIILHNRHFLRLLVLCHLILRIFLVIGENVAVVAVKVPFVERFWQFITPGVEKDVPIEIAIDADLQAKQ